MPEQVQDESPSWRSVEQFATDSRHPTPYVVPYLKRIQPNVAWTVTEVDCALIKAILTCMPEHSMVWKPAFSIMCLISTQTIHSPQCQHHAQLLAHNTQRAWYATHACMPAHFTPSNSSSMSFRMERSWFSVSSLAFHMPRPDASIMRLTTFANACAAHCKVT